MVNNNDLINLVENKKPVEEVREIENEIPSFEEFLKTYENDGNLNYADLSSSDVGTVKGYGPVGDYTWREVRNGTVYTGCGQNARSVTVSRFYLKVECRNWGGGGGYDYVRSTSEALQHAHKLEDGLYSNVSNDTERKCATLIREAVRHYDRGNKVNGYVKTQSNLFGSCEWSYNY